MSTIAILNANPSKEELKQWGSFADMAIEMFEATRSDFLVSKVDYEVYNVYDNEFPTILELCKGGCLGLYITGSTSDAYTVGIDWIDKLRKFLRSLLENSAHPPISGICFGHQIFASALGSEVRRNPNGYEGGITRLKITKDALKLGLFQKPATSLPSYNFYASESHSDVVENVPEGYINILTSEKCEVQGLYKRNVALTFQGHPDFLTEVCIKCNEATYNRGEIGVDELIRIKESGKEHINDGRFLATFIWKLFTKLV
ncbi:LAQU0S17e02696g1_1 [Lachancea quebecensis]|uniref:LAQU0S17e02696g1_1 n=1 Tax=Lachancea quebecensis TaxID=1654605 RepID=A0A0P1KYR0_9SACH|nr:LAQU0S17e02696g1_1 [Lachancea quebecensis]